jgi:uncharacterized protein YndB with AHSA1/START domain
MNETLRTVDGRQVLRFERRLSHPREKVWRAVTEPGQLSQWYPFPVIELEPRVGVRIVFDGGQGTTMDGAVTEFHPPRAFAFKVRAGAVLEREGENLLRFELHSDGAGCLLIFTHTFDDRPHAAANAAGWHGCLDALEMLVDRRPVEFPDRVVERHEAYVEAFGLGEGSVEATADGWRVRFERQLMRQPVDRVWATLTSGGSVDPVHAARPVAVRDAAPDGSTTAEVGPGTVTAVAAPTLLEYEWEVEGRAAGRVRWELGSSPAGARVVLTQTGPTELAAERSVALAAWRSHLERLAKRLRDLPS